jgi:integral membrane sensor domain MASE1
MASVRRGALTALAVAAFVVVYVVVAAVATDFAAFMGISPWWLPSALKFAVIVRLAGAGRSWPSSPSSRTR